MSEHATHAMHANSQRAFAEGIEDMSRRARECYAVLAQSLEPLTDRQIMHYLGYSDMNAVRPRLTELVDQLWAEEVGSVRDTLTGKTVRRLRAIPAYRRMVLIKQRMEEQNQNQLKMAFA